MKGHDGKTPNRNFYATIYFMTFFCVIALSGCGGGGGSSSSTPTGSVDGYIYLKAASKQKPAGLLLAKEIPAGYIAVPDVTVTLTGTSFTVKTDANGYFIFNSVPVGTYTLSAAKEGYQTITSAVSVSAGTTSSAADTVAAPDTKANYFPLETGNKWEYNVSITEGPFQQPVDTCVRKPAFTQVTLTATGTDTWTVESTKDINNVTTYGVKESISKNWDNGTTENITNTSYYAWNDNQLLKYGYESTMPQTSTTYSTPLKDLVLPLYAGATWTNPDAGLGVQTYVVETQENVTTTAGTFSSYRMTYSFPGIENTQYLLWYMSKGLVKRDFFVDKIENWQVTDYDCDKPPAGAGVECTGPDLDPAVTDTGCNNLDILDDQVELLGYSSYREIYELKSYSVASKLAAKEEALKGFPLSASQANNFNKAPLPKAKSSQSSLFASSYFYPNPSRKDAGLHILYAVNPLNVVRVTIAIASVDGGSVYFVEADPYSVAYNLSGNTLSQGLHFVTVTAYTADGNAESITKPLLIY